MRSTAEATPNIAFVKYWGKRDEKLFLPTNSSVSATMDFTLTTRTSVVFGDFTKDKAWLDGKIADQKTQKTVSHLLDLLRNDAKTKQKARVYSINDFPTAAGFASSASGMAALAVAASNALSLDYSAKKLSIIARQGSGSATRSVMGGFVEWTRGEKKDGSDSYARQLFDERHWRALRNVIAITAPEKKKVSSRSGMSRTVKTSTLYAQRLKTIPNTIATVQKAIGNRDGPMLYEAIMREAQNMHAVMLDTWPPITYLNDISKRIMHEVLSFNGSDPICGYTFDAGPNAHVFCEEKNASSVSKMLSEIEGVQKVMNCGIGPGPKISDNHLLDEDGNLVGA